MQLAPILPPLMMLEDEETRRETPTANGRGYLAVLGSLPECLVHITPQNAALYIVQTTLQNGLSGESVPLRNASSTEMASIIQYRLTHTNT